jgi:hypothetical protein
MERASQRNVIGTNICRSSRPLLHSKPFIPLSMLHQSEIDRGPEKLPKGEMGICAPETPLGDDLREFLAPTPRASSVGSSMVIITWGQCSIPSVHLQQCQSRIPRVFVRSCDAPTDASQTTWAN